MSKTTCKGRHTGHLCVLVSKGEFEKIRELVKRPKFVCFNCGRAASSGRSLCNPMPLEG